MTDTQNSPITASNAAANNIIRQWVQSVIAFSSQYNNDTWSANKIIGPPQVYPNYGDLHNAWAQANDFHANHFIELEFPTEVFVSHINIYETFHAGAISKIKLRNKDLNVWKTVWETSVGPLNIESSRIFSPELQIPSYKANQVRIELDCTAANSYCELDAVELVGKKYMIDSVQTEITLSHDFGKLLLSEEFSDIKFEVEGEILNAHRNILVARSNYFRAMLCENLKQDRLAKPIHIDNISYEGFKVLLHYFYTGNIIDSASVQIACELKRISDWYDLDDLNAKSFTFIQTKLSIDNVIGAFVSAHTLQPKLEDIENISLRFIAKNFNHLLEKPEFKTLSQNLLIVITQFYAQFHK